MTAGSARGTHVRCTAGSGRARTARAERWRCGSARSAGHAALSPVTACVPTRASAAWHQHARARWQQLLRQHAADAPPTRPLQMRSSATTWLCAALLAILTTGASATALTCPTNVSTAAISCFVGDAGSTPPRATRQPSPPGCARPPCWALPRPRTTLSTPPMAARLRSVPRRRRRLLTSVQITAASVCATNNCNQPPPSAATAAGTLAALLAASVAALAMM
jgi:hypothetical protein